MARKKNSKNKTTKIDLSSNILDSLTNTCPKETIKKPKRKYTKKSLLTQSKIEDSIGNPEDNTHNTENNTLNIKDNTLNTEDKTLNTEDTTLNTEDNTLITEVTTLNTDDTTFNTNIKDDKLNTEDNTLNINSENNKHNSNPEGNNLNTDDNKFNSNLEDNNLNCNPEDNTFNINPDDDKLNIEDGKLNTEDGKLNTDDNKLNSNSVDDKLNTEDNDKLNSNSVDDKLNTEDNDKLNSNSVDDKLNTEDNDKRNSNSIDDKLNTEDNDKLNSNSVDDKLHSNLEDNDKLNSNPVDNDKLNNNSVDNYTLNSNSVDNDKLNSNPVDNTIDIYNKLKSNNDNIQTLNSEINKDNIILNVNNDNIQYKNQLLMGLATKNDAEKVVNFLDESIKGYDYSLITIERVNFLLNDILNIEYRLPGDSILTQRLAIYTQLYTEGGLFLNPGIYYNVKPEFNNLLDNKYNIILLLERIRSPQRCRQAGQNHTIRIGNPERPQLCSKDFLFSRNLNHPFWLDLIKLGYQRFNDTVPSGEQIDTISDYGRSYLGGSDLISEAYYLFNKKYDDVLLLNKQQYMDVLL